MTNFKLSKRSMEKLYGVHPDLVSVVMLAITITETDFTVTEGVRTKEQQQKNVERGVSWTMRSMHLRQHDGFSHAVDLYPYVNGRMVNDWKVPWLSKEESKKAWDDVSGAMKKAAEQLGVKIEWGGDWKKTPDGPHYQLVQS